MRTVPHPADTLNELSGEEWLYFTKSVLTTAYPSELGHALRRAHGANKPPRLMARLIEFFTRPGELVLDPFAGVGGTLLGAAIARGSRRALGFELNPRWAAIYSDVVAAALAERDGAGPLLADLGNADPAGIRTFDPAGCELRVGDALELLPGLPAASVDFVATDPPYTVQLPLTMAGGPLAARHANRRTDYAMVSGDPADLANAPTHDAYLGLMERAFGEVARVLRPDRYAAVIVRDAYLDGRYRFTGAELAARAEAAGLVPKGGHRLVPGGNPAAALRLPARLRAEHRPPAHRGAAQGAARQTPLAAPVRGEVRQDDVIVRHVRHGAGRVLGHQVTERHPVEPALPAVGRHHAAVGAPALEDLDLVALVNRVESLAQELVGSVEELDEPVPNHAALAPGP